MYSEFMFRRNMKLTLPTTTPLPVFFSLKKSRQRWQLGAMPRKDS
jgi:hypothetical protein